MRLFHWVFVGLFGALGSVSALATDTTVSGAVANFPGGGHTFSLHTATDASGSGDYNQGNYSSTPYSQYLFTGHTYARLIGDNGSSTTWRVMSQPTFTLNMNWNGGANQTGAVTNCWWQAEVKWTNTSETTWAMLDFNLLDGDGDNWAPGDVDPNLEGYSGVPVPPSTVFSKILYLGETDPVSAPWDFVAPGGTAYTPTWQAGNTRAGNNIPDTSGTIEKICSTNSIPENPTNNITTLDISMSLTNGFNAFDQITNGPPTSVIPVSTNLATTYDVNKAANLTAQGAAAVERAVRDLAQQELTNSTASGSSSAALLVSVTNLSNQVGAATNYLGQVLTNLVGLRGDLTNGVVENTPAVLTNVAGLQLGNATNSAAWLSNQVAGWGTNSNGWWWEGITNGQGVFVGGASNGVGLLPGSGWGTNGFGAGDGQDGSGAGGSGGANDYNAIAGASAEAGWAVLTLGWGDWTFDLKSVLRGGLLSDPNSGLLGTGAGSSGITGTSGLPSVIRLFLLWIAVVMLYKEVFELSYAAFFDAAHTPHIPPSDYSVMGTTVPLASSLEILAKASFLIAFLLIIPSFAIATLTTVFAMTSYTLPGVIAALASGPMSMVTSIPGVLPVAALLNEWIPLAEYGLFALNYFGAWLALDYLAIQGSILAKFI